jgi:hypothetical protein
MATTQTPRLNLQKQDEKDEDWHTDLDAGFDNADLRLLKISSANSNYADPNTPGVAGDYVGQMYLDETADPPRWWNCTTLGGAGVAVWELIGTTGIYTSVAKEGNQNLETILADYQTRISTLEDTILPGFNGERFQSGELALAADSINTTPHGLTGLPILYSVILRCKVTDEGYAADDEVDVRAVYYNDSGIGTDYSGLVVGFDSSDFFWIVADDGIAIPRKTTSHSVRYLSLSSWKLVVNAWY